MSESLTYYAGAGDCWADKFGNFDNGGIFMWFGGSSGGSDANAQDWMGFASIGLPKMQIISATLTLTCSASGLALVDITVGGEAADSPSAPTDKNDLFARAMTTATIATNFTPTTAGNSQDYDVTAIVQELLNRAGWAYGNTMAILVRDRGTFAADKNKVATSENGTYQAAKLVITFSPFVPKFSGLI